MGARYIDGGLAATLLVAAFVAFMLIETFGG